jgi:hypothetical protein
MKKENRDEPLAPTQVPVTEANLLGELQKASAARLKAKREQRAAEKTKQEKPTLTRPSKLQGLSSLKNTLGKQYYRPTTETLAKRVKK